MRPGRKRPDSEWWEGWAGFGETWGGFRGDFEARFSVSGAGILIIKQYPI